MIKSSTILEHCKSEILKKKNLKKVNTLLINECSMIKELPCTILLLT